ncbi:hypothetical protein Tco_1273821 [Tanacetum coccineum]
MSHHKRIYVTPSHTKKIFGNMKREGKGFSGRVTPLFQTMMVQAHKEVGEEHIADEVANEENVPTQSNDLPLLRVNTFGSGEDRLSLKELMDLYIKLSNGVLDVETTKTTQAKEIASLKKRFKKLERKRKSKTPGMKRLFKIGIYAQVVSSKDDGLGVLDEQEVKVDKVVVQEPMQSTTTIAPSTIPRAKGIVFHEQKQAPTPIVSSQQPTQVKDKTEEEEQARHAREKAEKVEEANISWDNVQAMIEADRLLAERLQEREQEELTDE